MTQSCRRGGCPHRRSSELDALVAESGCCVTAIEASLDRIMEDVAGFDGAVSVTSNAVAVMTEIGRPPAVSHAGAPFELPSRGGALRVDPTAVGSVLAVERAPYGRLPCSVQFYAREGAAQHKLFLASLTDDYAFAEMTRDWSAPCGPAPGAKDPRAGTFSDLLSWRCGDLRFHVDSLFGDAGLRRRACLPEWGAGHAWRIDPELAVHLLGLVTEIRAPVTVIVPNNGFAQCFTGAYDGMRRAGDGLRLGGPQSTVSLNLADVEEAWITRRDEDGGSSLSLELYDWGFQCVAQVTAASGDERLARFWNQTVRDIPRLG